LPFDFCAGFLWIGRGNDLCKVDPLNGQIRQRIKCPWRTSGHIGASDSAVYAGQWQGASGGSDIVKFDAATGRQTARLRIAGPLRAGDLAVQKTRDGKVMILAMDWTNNHLYFYEGE
jgi:hypothetical protein